jgi:tetracycline resistance efflux pump
MMRFLLTTETSLLVLLSALVTVSTATLTRRPIESFLAGAFTGLLILEPAAALSNFSSIQLAVMIDETIA